MTRRRGRIRGPGAEAGLTTAPGDHLQWCRTAILPEVGAPAVAEFAAALGENGRVEIVAGSDARFLAGLPGVGNLAVEWMEAG